MNEMIRRAAKAAYEKRRELLRDQGVYWTPWSKLPTEERMLELVAQRAAIEAMHEPTQGMVSAANRNNHPRDEETWRTMIKEALRD